MTFEFPKGAASPPKDRAASQPPSAVFPALTGAVEGGDLNRRNCEQCGARLWRRKNEKAGQWAARKFCSQICGIRFRVDHPDLSAYKPKTIDATKVLREWPEGARFDAPGMNVPDGPGHFVRFQPPQGRWI